MPRRACAVTGSRTECGLLFSLCKELAGNHRDRLQLAKTGVALLRGIPNHCGGRRREDFAVAPKSTSPYSFFDIHLHADAMTSRNMQLSEVRTSDMSHP